MRAGARGDVARLDAGRRRGGGAGVAVIDFDQFVYRAATPLTVDLVLGAVTTLLVLEATRRTVGPILPVTAVAFLLYGYYGPYLELVGLELFAHRGYDSARLVGTLYMTLEGIFGVPLNVCATFIILFTIFGANPGQVGSRTVLHQLDDGRVRTLGERGGPRPDGDSIGVPARYRVGKRRRDDGDARRGGLAAAPACGLLGRDRWRHPVGERHRGDHGPADDGGRRVPHRRVPADQLSAGDHHGDRPGHPLLPLYRADDRGGRPPAGNEGGHRRPSVGRRADAPPRLPVPAAHRHRRAAGERDDGVPGRLPVDAAGHRAQFPQPRERALAAPAGRGARGGRPQRALGRGGRRRRPGSSSGW